MLVEATGLRVGTCLLTALVTVGLFAAPTHAEAVQVCINKKTGAVRVLLASQSCRKTETLQQWSTTSTTIDVVDSSGQVIGKHVFATGPAGNGSGAVINFAGTDVLLPISLDGSPGFVDGYFGNGTLAFWHASPDCSGQRYLLGTVIGPPLSMMATAVIFQGKAYFPQLPYTYIHINSIETISEGGDPSQPGGCQQNSGNGGTYPLGIVQTGDVSAFVPPFHLNP